MKLARRISTLAAAACFAAAWACFGQVRSPDLEAVAHSVSVLTNDFRRQDGRQAVEANRSLADAARYFADYMARNGRLDHRADGRDVAMRAAERGYDYCIISENIAYEYHSDGFTTAALARAFVEGWKNSPGHRHNMLDPDVTEAAVAVARGGNGYYYAVQIFGRPSTALLRFQIANTTTSPVRYRVGQGTIILAPRQIRTHEQCRPQPLTVDWPGSQQDTTVLPGDGDRLSIVRSESGALRLEKE